MIRKKPIRTNEDFVYLLGNSTGGHLNIKEYGIRDNNDRSILYWFPHLQHRAYNVSNEFVKTKCLTSGKEHQGS